MIDILEISTDNLNKICYTIESGLQLENLNVLVMPFFHFKIKFNKILKTEKFRPKLNCRYVPLIPILTKPETCRTHSLAILT